MGLDDNIILARTAHELRVPLSLISGSLDVLSQYTDVMLEFINRLDAKSLSLDERRRLQQELRLGHATSHAVEILEICREGARRLAHVIERLHVSGSRRVAALQPVPLAAVVHAAAQVVMRSSAQRVSVAVDIEETLSVVGAPDLLGQVFVNLLGNAFDALAGSDAPNIRVAADLAADDTCPLVEISVHDNGPGVPPALRDHIFEPFISTKSAGQGAGLGLAIVSDILLDMHGSIRLASTASGAEFVVCLQAPSADYTQDGSMSPGQ